MNHCATCKHWGDKRDERYQREQRECFRLSYQAFSSNKEKEVVIAYAEDDDGYSAILVTRGDFGCVLHAPCAPEQIGTHSDGTLVVAVRSKP